MLVLIWNIWTFLDQKLYISLLKNSHKILYYLLHSFVNEYYVFHPSSAYTREFYEQTAQQLCLINVNQAVALIEGMELADT